MVLNLTGHIGVTTAVRQRSDSGWSWTFRIARVTLHDGWLGRTTDVTNACMCKFCRCLFDRLSVRISTLYLLRWILRKKKSIRSKLKISECSFASTFQPAHYNAHRFFFEWTRFYRWAENSKRSKKFVRWQGFAVLPYHVIEHNRWL